VAIRSSIRRSTSYFRWLVAGGRRSYARALAPQRALDLHGPAAVRRTRLLGNEFVDTPNVDRLAAAGVQFDRCFAQSPICTPSRASFLTGRYPRTTRCRQNGQALPTDEELVTERLSDAGYTCGLAGKLHLAPCNPGKSEGHPMTEERTDDGYADVHWSHYPGHDVTGNEYLQWLHEQGVDVAEQSYVDPASGARRFDLSADHDDPRVRESEHIEVALPAEHHQTTWCARKATTFIEDGADRDRPWLFSVNPFDPHHPFDPPAAYLDRYLDDLEDLPLPAYAEGELDDKPPWQANDHEGAYNTEGYYPHAGMSPEDHRLVRAAYFAMVDLIDDAVGLDRSPAVQGRSLWPALTGEADLDDGARASTPSTTRRSRTTTSSPSARTGRWSAPTGTS
jgi:arylsulfatase A-like enzyme